MTTKPSFVMVPSRSLSAQISPQLFRYFCWLCNVADRKGVSWWSRRRTAELFGVTHRTVTVWRSTLESHDLISIRRRYGRASVLTVIDYPTPDRQLGMDFGSDYDQPEMQEDSGVNTHEYLPDEHTEQETKEQEPNTLPPLTPPPQSTTDINQKLEQMRREIETIKLTQSKPPRTAADEYNLTDEKHHRTIERLITAASVSGLKSWGARILELRDPDNRDRILACSYLTDEALEFAFEDIKRDRFTVDYPRRTWYWLDRLIDVGSIHEPNQYNRSNENDEITEEQSDSNDYSGIADWLESQGKTEEAELFRLKIGTKKGLIN